MRGGGGAARSGRSRAKRGGTGKPSTRTLFSDTPARRITEAVSSFATMKVSLGQRYQMLLMVIESVTTV